MELTQSQKEHLAHQANRISSAYKQVCKKIQRDMDEMAYGFTADEKEVMSKMILKLIKGCKTPSEVEDVLWGRSEHSDLVQQMDEITITGSIYIIEALSKKYVDNVPSMDDFEFLTDKNIDKLAAAIAQKNSMVSAMEDSQIEDFWEPSPFQDMFLNEADSFSMTNTGFNYPLTPINLLAEPFREIMLYQNDEFNKKYKHMSYEQRLELCQMAEELVDKTKTKEETTLFFVRPKGQKEKILPKFNGLSFEERKFLKEATGFYFRYKKEHPGVIKTSIRKICSWMGKPNPTTGQTSNLVSNRQGASKQEFSRES